ncbi:MAG: DUF5320 domain-containing protein [candidate division Zixibacteria bacterium]|nr:DUF5320 domain-containing protein [candidate division Zixibacteria bacterium]
MPGGDRTGPSGAGPRTGRAAGFCTGSGMPGYANRGFGGGGYGRGFGMGYGRGLGRGFRGGGRGGGWYRMPFMAEGPYVQPYEQPYYPHVSAVDEVKELKSQEKYFSTMLKDLRSRIEGLESKKSSQNEK